MNLPRRINADDPRLADVLALIRRSFAYMDGRIDPPSSMHRLTVDRMKDHCEAGGEIWAAGSPPVACIFLTPKADCLYLGKLAVDQAYRGSGLARQLVDLAARRTSDLGLPALELQTRIELVENHRAFARLGFVKTAESSHPGHNRVTDITMRMTL
ncbi:GNAT family N-acetyltransferase [Leisingera aquimarina]|uniref:GNAT family N-acetyltransferase n=1 Tax=Leisingera aquimarina TaxID=476529 RepID=UPI0004224F8E|nr:GNAT family N-acetyltransferase [Leisingera aquimarina]